MILYFSGTGNSKYVAQRMAEALNQSLLSMNDRIRSHDTSPVETDERLVIVTPTYAWRIPRLVRDWLLETEFPGAAQVWFIMTCGSEIGHASRYNRSLCQTKGLTDMGTAQIIMPENYIAMFDAPQAEEARHIVAKAQPDINRSIAAVREGRLTPAQSEGLAAFMANLSESDAVAFSEGGKELSPVAFMKTFLSRLPVQVEFAEKSAGADETIDGLSPLDAANRAVAYQERMKRDGVVITTTEALSAVKAGKDNGAQ